MDNRSESRAFGDFFNDMIAQYESENPGVTVNWTDVPYGDIQSKLVTSVAGGATAGRCELKHTVYFNISRTGSIS
ncbi:MAG: extracellular solute-binding protein [Roseburia inulinivorans]